MKNIDEYASSRENNFDFIRFAAATAVVFSHSYPLTTSDNNTEPLFVFSNGQCSIGDIAVGIFFIISGFLITQSYLKSKNLKNYFLSRSLRIFPALTAVIALLVFVIGPLISSYPFQNYFSNSMTYHYLMNIFVFTDKENSSLPGVFLQNEYSNIVNGSLWTLNYELMCYLAVPAIALFIKRKWLPALALLIAVVVIIFNFLFAPCVAQIFLCSSFLSGSLFYVFRKKIPLSGWIALLSIVLLAISIKENYFLVAFPLLAGYAIFYLSFVPRSALFRFAKYGDFSYGIYIWAFPIQQIVAEHYEEKGNYFNAAVSFPVILLLSILSWHLIEKRALALKKKILRKESISG